MAAQYCNFSRTYGETCLRPLGHSGPCHVVPSGTGADDFEKRVIQAAMAWCERPGDIHDTAEERELRESVRELKTEMEDK